MIEQNQRFLVVEEYIDDKLTLNQPAGHLEDGESLIDAIIRETKEETAWDFTPTALIGIYRWQHPKLHETFIRFCFTGKLGQFDKSQALDSDIEQTRWLDKQQLLEQQDRMRSPLVLTCFNDYLSGQRHPLTLLHN